MIITRTPFRISLFGGGTDYPVWYREHGGAVLSATINKYCYICGRFYPPFFENKYLIRYRLREETRTVDEIQHPAVRECLKYLQIQAGVEIIHTADVPARSGIGSSSSFTVGLLQTLHALVGRMVTPRQLAREAIEIEQQKIGESVGSQDQVAAAFGGLNKIEFGGAREFYVTPITVGRERRQALQSHCLLFFSGLARNASEVAREQIRQTPARAAELHRLAAMVDEAVTILNDPADRVAELGALLDEGWQLKRRLTDRVSTAEIDAIYQRGRAAGALGGKLLGAGGGGFMLLFAPPERHAAIRAALAELLYVPFVFEDHGSQVIMYSTQDFF